MSESAVKSIQRIPADKDRFPSLIATELVTISTMQTTDTLAVFVNTVDLGSFAAAGLAGGITASAAARIVTRMEAQLGAKLLARSTRRLVLTQEGEAYLPHARTALAAVDSAFEVVAVDLGCFDGVLVRGEHGLDLIPDFGGNQRRLVAFVAGAPVNDIAFVVGVRQHPVNCGDSQGFGWASWCREAP